MRRAHADWVDDEDERLRQAMAYRALTPDERATFVVHRPPDDEERAARKRQRLDQGARCTPLRLWPHLMRAGG